MNATWHRLTIFSGLGIAAVALFLPPPLRGGIALAGVGSAWLANALFAHGLWGKIQDGRATLTPRGAALWLLLPGLNIYGVFRVLPGFATDYAKFVLRHRVPNAPRLSQNLILASLVVPGVGLVVYWVVIGRLCRAVNAIAEQSTPITVTTDLEPVAR